MAVKNIECQLAEMQIGRYVSGEPFSPEAVRQLEAHVDKCPRCADILNDRKASLRAMLQREPRAAVQMPEPSRSKADDNPLLKALREKAPAVAPKKPVGAPSIQQAAATGQPSLLKTYWKPIMLSGALAIVMIAMSWFSRDQTSVLGDSADKLPAKIDATVAPPHKKSPKNSKPKKNPATIPPAGLNAETPPANPAPAGNSANPTSDEKTQQQNGQPNAPAKADRSNAGSQVSGVGSQDNGAAEDPAPAAPVRARRVHHAPRPTPRRYVETRTWHRPKPAADPKAHRPKNSIKVYSPDGDPM